ncbi:MAG: TPM domain-containing protein [Streptococcaceae bacterium]|jgi:uncharacterized protein|nr:TPM domain-containing protein [Streptococcaceae bacterium]
MKKIICAVAFLLCLISVKVKASEVKIEDNLNLFNEELKAKLLPKMQEEAKQLKSGIFILTTDEYTDDIQSFSDYYLSSQVGENKNGIAMVINMNTRNIHITTSGLMIKFWTNSRLNKSLDNIQSDLKDASYDSAASQFVTDIAKYRKAGISGEKYEITSSGQLIIKKAITLTEASIAALIALLVAVVFFILTQMKYQLKIGNYNYDYQKNSTLKITEHQDKLVNSYVTTRVIPKPKSDSGGTHTTGGGSFGGGSRSF